MSTYPDPCVCGGSREKPNDDCERCRLLAELAAERKRADEAEAKLRRIDAEDTADAGVMLAAFNRVTAAESARDEAVRERERLKGGCEKFIVEMISQAAQSPKMSPQEQAYIHAADWMADFVRPGSRG